ncbi:hypothetical protein Glove_177g89 [Diversispora epigaea]|uniref:Uncharacterized protein n=1 Tax=Diversispora epigaea TaxID=1348612 RepID=A0A397IT30_9GLOM|nr:hypothetical protein Glove_177g89 [Diversispora epigaea]
MPSKIEWKINYMCEFKSSKDSQCDPTHVFKKLRNNLTKSHTGEKNTREIMFEGKEIKYTLSKEVEDALASIEELKEISKGTRVCTC